MAIANNRGKYFEKDNKLNTCLSGNIWQALCSESLICGLGIKQIPLSNNNNQEENKCQ